jgi:hypothetical protein
MHSLFARAAWILGLFTALLVSGCGWVPESGQARLRLVNASSGYGALSLTVDEKTVASGVAFGADTGYADAEDGTNTAELSADGSATVLVSTSVSMSKGDHYSLLAYGKSGALSTVLLDENQDEPSSGKALVRVINTAADAGKLDVYLTGASETLSGSNALQADAAYGTLGSFVTINSGSWRLRVTAADSTTDLRLDLSGLEMSEKTVYTLVLTPGSGGVLVNAILVKQDGSVQLKANPQARVRVVAGAAASGTVVASVAGSTLMNGLASPSLTAYTLVPAGSAAVTASVGGSAAPLTSATLAAGGDYTLLVYGSTAAPAATLLADDNAPPTVSTQAKVRLVHGLGDLAGTLAMKIDLEAAADGVATGTASAYTAVEATTTALVEVTSGSTPYYSAADRTFLANGVYTVFVLGAAGTPTGVLRKDR